MENEERYIRQLVKKMLQTPDPTVAQAVNQWENQEETQGIQGGAGKRLKAWHQGEKPTGRETLAAIRRATPGDQKTRQALTQAYRSQQSNPASPLYNPYAKPQGKPAMGLAEAEKRTQRAEAEWDELRQELAYGAFQGDNDEDALRRVNWNRYPTLRTLEDGLRAGRPPALTRPVGFSEDHVYGTLWAARNNGGTGDADKDAMLWALEQKETTDLSDLYEDADPSRYEEELAQTLGYRSFAEAKGGGGRAPALGIYPQQLVSRGGNRGRVRAVNAVNNQTSPVDFEKLSMVQSPQKERGPDGDEEVYFQEIVTPAPLAEVELKPALEDFVADQLEIGDDRGAPEKGINFSDALAYGYAYNNDITPEDREELLQAYYDNGGQLTFDVRTANVYSDGKYMDKNFDPYYGNVADKSKWSGRCAKYVSGILRAGGLDLSKNSQKWVDSLYAELVGGNYTRDGVTHNFETNPNVRAVLELSTNGPLSQDGMLSVEEQYQALVEMGVVQAGDVAFAATNKAEDDLSHVMMFNRVDENGLYYCGETTSRYDVPLTNYITHRRENDKKEPYMKIVLFFHDN